ncbi:MAG TPA: protein kinase [Kofleriaceae bacterium]|nr:protein kinase [Kofleriaceae bacterium]
MNPARESIATETFGPYEVYERLGMGGMASVHRAKKRGPAGFEQTVALKRMLAHLTEDRGFIDSFVREAKVASMLAHPNIAQVYDFGRIGGIFYIAMELVAGFDLRKLLRHAHRTGEAIPLGIILSILAELCDALDYAHSFVDENGQPLNIIHRDISPSNIIVAQTGHVKVIDFGIAKANSRQLHTESGLVKGKLGYMAPEAAMGLQIGPQADIFSVGVTAWELVTALPLFSARTDFETMRKLREEPVTPPSYNNPACPPRLDALILAALGREPEQRLGSARIMRNEIDAIAQQHNVQLSGRAVADWTRRLAAQSEANARAATASDPRMRSPSGRVLPLPPPEQQTSVSRPRSKTQPQTLRRSNEDIALATEIWGEEATQGAPSGPDFSAAAGNSIMPVTAPPAHDMYAAARVQTAADVTVPPIAMHPSGQHMFTPAQSSGPYLQTDLAPIPPMLAPQRQASKSKLPLVILAVLAIAAGILGALLYLKKSTPAPAPSVSIKFEIEPKGSIVDVAGKEIGGSPVETQLAPGVYSITVHNDGYKTWTTSLAVHDGEDQTINIALEHEAVAVAPPPPEPTPAPDTPPPQQPQPEPTLTPRPPPGHSKHTTKHHVEKTPEVATAEPPKVEPPKVDPPKVDPPKVEPPVVDNKPAGPIGVAANTVTKVSGELPVLHGNGEASGNVMAKMCIDEQGKVSSVKIKQSPPEIANDLQRALSSWRYKPYMKGDKAVSVCFLLQIGVVLKP